MRDRGRGVDIKFVTINEGRMWVSVFSLGLEQT